jgi:hypothetical protein
MSYVSGRTVKPTSSRKPTTVASATRDARRLVTRYLPIGVNATVNSSITADPKTLATQVRTHITFPNGTPIVGLTEAARELPGIAHVTSYASGVMILRNA